ncbi:MAG: InlB B-repeat-containing protein [Bacilli bacterium]|nr:InlB B-repeat-containing protein [Bacilli bacterium]
MSKNKKNKNLLFKRILLTCFIFMLAFSVFNIGKVLAGVDRINVTNAIISDKSSTTEAAITSISNDKVVTDVKYHNVNEYVEYTIILRNNDSKNYTIKTITDNNSDPYIVYDYAKHENEKLLAGNKKDIVIKATYKTEVTNINERKANDNVEIKITFIEEDGSESNKIVPINPKTADNIWIYVCLGVLSLSGLLFTLKFKKTNKALLILLLMTPFIAKAANITYDFSFVSEIGYYDRMLVTIDRNGTKEEIIIPYGTKITEPDVIAIPGYDFVGWVDKDENPADFTNDITEDTIIKGKYNLLTYDITYNLNGGSVSGNPTTYTVENEFTLKNPKLTGYNFAGWTGTNLPGLTPTVTIHKGTINDLSFTANFLPATNTKYKVNHKYQQVTGDGYDNEEENGTGVTGTTIYPQVKPRTGFTTPTVQSLYILPDGSASIDYVYDRVPCNYEFDSNTNSSLANGTYRYGTQITVSPKEIQGYTFTKWEDNSTNNPRTITLTGNTSVTPTYSANTNTEYKIIHRYQTLNNTYEEVTRTKYGTTDTTIPAEIEPRTGFVTPTEQNITILGDESAEVTYTYDRIPVSFSITDRTYIDLSSSSDDTYLYGTEVTAKAIERAGYTFKWSDNDTNYTRTITLTGDVSLTPNYTARTDTAYIVNHNVQKLNGTYETRETEHKTGTTDTNVTPATKTYPGFTSPSTQTNSINGDGSTSFDYNYLRNQYNLIINNPSDVVEGDISGQYYYEQQITLTAKDKEGYTFTKWSNNETTKTITITMGTSDITIEPLYTINSYTITFDTQGGTPVSAIVQDYGNPIGTIDETTKDGSTFDGWWTDPDGGIEIDENTLVTGNDTYYAHWIENKIICKKATTLTTATCNIDGGSNGCPAAGYSLGETIEYGNVIRTDSYNVGDAFDCDVDGSGYTYRFYYLRTKDDKAVLIFNHNFEGANGISDANNFTYDVALTKLPTTTQWDNLPVTYGDYAARFVSWDDLSTAAGTDNLTATKALKNLPFLFENIGKFTTGDGRSTVWVEAVDDGTTVTGYRYHVNDLKLQTGPLTGNKPSSNCVRPVIEVPLTAIEDDYIVEYNAESGTLANKYALIKKGSKLLSLPTPTYTGHVFGGWYDSALFSTLIDENHIPSGYETYYAKYLKEVGTASLDYDEFDLTIGDEDTITFVDEANVEDKTYASNDDTIASVDQNGKITANAVGTTSIVITGSSSGTTKVVSVKVQAEVVSCTIEFDENGGSDVSDMIVNKNSTFAEAGGLPEPLLTNYTFAGWFTDNTYERQVTNDTIVKGDMILIAKWIPSDAVAEVDGTYFTSLSDAITNVPVNGTIKILKDFTLGTSIDIRKNLNIDLNKKTITSTGRAFQIYSKVEIGNGTITTNGGSGIIDVVKENNIPGEFTMNSGSLINTRTANTRKQGIYVNGGIARIGGTAYIKSNADGNANPARATVQCLGGGTIYITGGTIVNEHVSSGNYSYAVANSSGTVIIGKEDGVYDATTPVIKGYSYGLKSDNNAKFSIYDGIIMGRLAAIDSEANIDNIETGAIKVNDTDGDYNTLYYQMPIHQITITLDTDGGDLPSGVNNYITINSGDQVGTLPVPTKGIYTFDGWFDEDDQPVLSTRTPSQNEEYHAVWSYTPSDTPVNFNMTNDVMMDYYSSIGTWKNQYIVTDNDKSDISGYTEHIDASEFEASMKANFDAHNCSACSNDPNNNKCDNPTAGDRCELPNGYDTGLGEAVNVYEYNTSTDEKTLVTYTTSDNGIIYNMIPGKTYRWESTTDSSIYGYVNPTAMRRTIYSSARNVRDLGGMTVSFERDSVTKTGTLKYGKLYRGAELSGGQSDVNSLTKLGITREVDLRVQTEGNNPARLPKHDKCDGKCGTLPSSEDIIITNYLIYPTYSGGNNYTALRNTLKYVMQSVVDGDNIYFHCTIGSDRTGTLAYFLEGLLGVPEEEKLEDYELSYFYGMLNRTRFHDSLSGSSINPRFRSMYKAYDTNDKIYAWYMYGLTDEQIASEKVLIEQFRDAMINYN